MELEYLKSQLNIKYYNNLIKATNRTNLKDNYLADKVLQVKDSCEILTSSITETDILNETSKIVYSEDYLYKRSWTKLSTIHKIIKMKEYVNQLLIDDPDEKKKLEKTLVNLVKKRVLTKKNRVKYNSIKGIIYSIPDLVYQKGIYSINIK